MKRREFIVLAVAGVALSLAAHAQQKSMPVIGFLTAIEVSPTFLDAFRSGLVENGLYERRNVAIKYRSADGEYARLPALAAELVDDRVDLIVTTGGSLSGLAAKAATETIPILVFSGDDPVKLGLVTSISHPGGNITGVAQLVTATDAKRLELLHELVPDANPIGYLINPASPIMARQAEEGISAMRQLGIHITALKAGNAADIAEVLSTMEEQRIRALYVGPDAYFYKARDQLVDLTTRLRVPTMYFFREFVVAGGLISYGTDLGDAYRQLGRYAGKILHGAKPADLPIVQQSEKIELVINLRTAKALGLTVPQTLLARADEVIE